MDDKHKFVTVIDAGSRPELMEQCARRASKILARINSWRLLKNEKIVTVLCTVQNIRISRTRKKERRVFYLLELNDRIYGLDHILTFNELRKKLLNYD